MRSTAEKLCDQMAPVFRALKGVRGMTFLVDDTAGDVADLTVW